jgi:calcium binding protein 39
VTGGGAAADGAGSLFRSKARGPVEVVRHARELLAFLAENHDACGDKRDVKREHKVGDTHFSCIVRSFRSVSTER